MAAREALALAGAIDLAPSVGRELRDDLSRMTIESFVIRESAADCAADHVLASAEVVPLGVEPGSIRFADLAKACALQFEDEIVLAGSELISTAICANCRHVSQPYTRPDRSAPAVQRVWG